jgi:hypothetical protein
VRAQCTSKPHLRHRAKRGRSTERVVEHVLPREIGKCGDELVVDIGMHINALDAASALA